MRLLPQEAFSNRSGDLGIWNEEPKLIGIECLGLRYVVCDPLRGHLGLDEDSPSVAFDEQVSEENPLSHFDRDFCLDARTKDHRVILDRTQQNDVVDEAASHGLASLSASLSAFRAF